MTVNSLRFAQQIRTDLRSTADKKNKSIGVMSAGFVGFERVRETGLPV